VLTEIKVKEGETVPVNSVVAVIGVAGEKSAPAPAAASGNAARGADKVLGAAGGKQSEMPEAAAGQPEAGPAVQAVAAAAEGDISDEDARRHKSSPLVRRIAREHNVDIRQINGTGISGRVTKNDILGFIETGPKSPTPAARPAPAAHIPAFKPGDKVEIVPMTIMRKKIAEHMVISAHTSPHVYSVYEVDFHRLSKLRDKKKAEYEKNGAKLSFTALIAKATVDAIRAFPVVNASIDGDNIVYKKDINLGIAVALDQGLLVPVIRNADERNLLGLSRAIDDLATRARSKKLNPDEVQGGTFTITNPGIFGAVYGLPLINQPQVAILGVGVIEKRAVVVDDAIAIHPTCHLSLGYDHRLIDGADAGRFLAYLKDRLENFDEGWI
jgi:pyruvate dehydrogenase E2 component (dihydrolipoamide acetyltransferase)